MATTKPRSKPTPRKGKGGRPTKLTKDITTNLLAALAHGCYVETACHVAGIHRDTFYGWMERAREAKDKGGKLTAAEGRLVEFSDSVKRTLASAELKDLRNIRLAAEGQWQAAAWRLERRYPERWGRTRHEVTGADGGPVTVANWAELVLRSKAETGDK